MKNASVIREKLSRDEMKRISGGAQKYQWNCYSGSAGDYYLTCSDVDPTAHCSGCGYSNCSMTGTKCNTITVCVC
ncbi:hypothetical protein [Mucilaginibacter xinganensis]|uniref:Uncharacterized protein n=1 Tax=Mucilaginibacter xinganensis TaxID=1234841 RepID=A0A223NSB2_9SPHI|nr:hypothetical protein [Mucilaginibacter xinganensis]ASU32548.1 hypothetical protein MuYL_0645 [Mucilaginibacter xinganensis]